MANNEKKVSVYTDGGARGNPGPAGIGAAILDEKGTEIDTVSRYIGKTTNNQAEYQALIAGLAAAIDLGATRADCYLDSELVVKQMKGEYRVRDKDLAPLFVKAWNLSTQFERVTYTHVRREKNKRADELVNIAIDRNV